MQLDENKFNIARARSGKTLKELGIDSNLIYRARKGAKLRAATVHRIAAALGVDPAEIIKGGDE